MTRVRDAGIVVIGSGLAGLLTALRLAPRPVTLLTKTPFLAGGSSDLAQGGVAAAVALDDSPADHAEDTLEAGAGLCDEAMVRLLAEDGAREAKALIGEGLPFDLDDEGLPLLGREGAHRRPRILHAGGDATGRTLVQALVAKVRAAPSITVIERAFAPDLALEDGRVAGVLASHEGEGLVFYRCPRVVLATGGIGGIYLRTTNPPEATADGLAMAARAGARLGDLEFMQFHPTALAVDEAGDHEFQAEGGVKPRAEGGVIKPMPLMTEALRGEGATLLDETGRRFMTAEHPLAELAPRDILARAVWRRLQAGETVRLDLRPALAKAGIARFPTVLAFCAEAGYDATTTPVPIAPAAHYHMGGVATDADGRTSVPGLWACGEIACTGVHGANRLASNSLLEAMVFSRRIAEDLARDAAPPPSGREAPPALPPVSAAGTASELAAIARGLRQTMYDHVGLWRDGEGLARAASAIDALAGRLAALRPDAAAGHDGLVRWGETRNLLLAGRLVTEAALRRRESRGAHFRADFPLPAEPALPRQFLTVADLPTQP